MTAVVVAERASPTLFDEPGGEPTLDEILAGVWEGLGSHRGVSCPVCGGEMWPASGAHGAQGGGTCTDCGSLLA